MKRRPDDLRSPSNLILTTSGMNRLVLLKHRDLYRYVSVDSNICTNQGGRRLQILPSVHKASEDNLQISEVL